MLNLADRLESLQSKKNSGRGVSVVRTIITYLRRGEIDLARNVYVVDGDKICAVYPDLDRMICEGLGIKPRYSNPHWPDKDQQKFSKQAPLVSS